MLYIRVRNFPELVSVKTFANLKLPNGIIVRKISCENGSGMFYLSSFTLIYVKQSLNLQTGICSTLSINLKSHSSLECQRCLLLLVPLCNKDYSA